MISNDRTLVYTPGAPNNREVIHRLACKAQILAIEYGVDLSWQEAKQRAIENLDYVRCIPPSAMSPGRRAEV